MPGKILSFITLIAMLFTLCSASANTEVEELKSQLQTLIKDKGIPGMVVLVEQNNAIVFHEGVGYSNIEQQTPMAKHQKFRWFSMSKPVTSLAMLKTLHDNGYDLDTELKTLYPNFDRDEQIPISTVLNHTAGFGYGGAWDSFTGWLYWLYGPLERASSLSELMSKLDGIPLLSEPGKEFRYSMSSDVLGAVIQKVNGHQFDRYMQDKIFTPLNMTSAGFITKENTKNTTQSMPENDLAPFYRFDKETKRSVLVDDPMEWDKHVLSGGGGMTGTASDYNQFLRVLKNPQDYTDFIPETLLAAMVKNQLPEENAMIPEQIYANTGYGFGVGVTLDDEQYLSKNSYFWAGLAGTIFWVDPEENISVVVMTQLLGGRKSIEKYMIPMVYNWLENKNEP